MKQLSLLVLILIFVPISIFISGVHPHPANAAPALQMRPALDLTATPAEVLPVPPTDQPSANPRSGLIFGVAIACAVVLAFIILGSLALMISRNRR